MTLSSIRFIARELAYFAHLSLISSESNEICQQCLLGYCIVCFLSSVLCGLLLVRLYSQKHTMELSETAVGLSGTAVEQPETAVSCQEQLWGCQGQLWNNQRQLLDC